MKTYSTTRLRAILALPKESLKSSRVKLVEEISWQPEQTSILFNGKHNLIIFIIIYNDISEKKISDRNLDLFHFIGPMWKKFPNVQKLSNTILRKQTSTYISLCISTTLYHKRPTYNKTITKLMKKKEKLMKTQNQKEKVSRSREMPPM